ncbi:hypothetical protein DC3_27490 [Deinococcus cellulosilyticus NBRC 106333 = KACC 11606]|uniref:Uncharacterized protein n=2 Tax=Deinococcus cellulosilyticus TaxID=401558 RepID=A0A511N2N2_DEIC1|nr:hypothetical protein DC3_27490 [Deinococcus cellulosilyticus NBRC 106333 = KACC 11606]
MLHSGIFLLMEERMNVTDARTSLDHLFSLLRDPDYDLFKHGQLNEELEALQRLTREPDSIQGFRHLTYAEMKGHRAELLEHLQGVPALLEQGRSEDAVQAIRAALRIVEAP